MRQNSHTSPNRDTGVRYWATLIDEFYRWAVILGLTAAAFWAWHHPANEKSQLVFGFIGLFCALGTLANAFQLIKAIQVWRKGNSGFVEILQKQGMEARRARRTYREPKEIQEKWRGLAAWALPILFGVPALGLLVIFLLLVTRPDPVRMHPWRDGIVVTALPIAMLCGVVFIIWKARNLSRDQGITLTAALYDWTYRNFEVRAAKRTARPPYWGKRARQLFSIGWVAAGILLIRYEGMNTAVEYLVRRPENILTLLDLMPWALIIVGFSNFLEELKYKD